MAFANCKGALPQDLSSSATLPALITAKTGGGINASNWPLPTLATQVTIEQ